MKLLELKHIRKSFGDLEVLKDISLTVNEGDVVSIIGPSGSGKSTLLRCATMLETIDSGEMCYIGDTAAWTGTDLKVHYAKRKDMKKIICLLLALSMLVMIPLEATAQSSTETQIISDFELLPEKSNNMGFDMVGPLPSSFLYCSSFSTTAEYPISPIIET